MARRLKHLHRFVAQRGLVSGEDRKGFESHGAHGSAVFSEARTNQRQQSHALRARGGVERGGDDNVAASLPLFDRQFGGDLGEDVAVCRKNARFAPADKACQLGCAAMVIGIIGAELADQLADSGFARLGFSTTPEEVFRCRCRVGGFPGSRLDRASFHRAQYKLQYFRLATFCQIMPN